MTTSKPSLKLYVIHATNQTKEAIGYSALNTSFYLISTSVDAAHKRAESLTAVKDGAMQISAVQQIDAIEGFRILTEYDETLEGETIITD